MDREKRRTIALGSGIVIAILLVVGYFVWENIINKGILIVKGEAPFTVEIYGEKTFTCDISPCEIVQKIGNKNLIINKQGYKSQIAEIEINLRKTTDLEVEFEINPYISETDSIPEISQTPEFDLIFDEENQMQKLIDSNDIQKKAIAYFQKEIKNPLIYSSNNAALIIDKGTSPMSAYKVDIIENSREKVTGLDENLEDGIWSDNGEYFVFSKTDSPYLWILENGTTKQLDLTVGISQVAWSYTDSLVFVTDQSYEMEIKAGLYGEKYIQLGLEETSPGYTFGEYHPVENLYTLIDTFSNIYDLPETLIPTSNGKTIYFKIGEVNYKLVISI